MIAKKTTKKVAKETTKETAKLTAKVATKLGLLRQEQQEALWEWLSVMQWVKLQARWLISSFIRQSGTNENA